MSIVYAYRQRLLSKAKAAPTRLRGDRDSEGGCSVDSCDVILDRHEV